MLTELFLFSTAGVVFSRDFRINLVGFKTFNFVFSSNCHNESIILYFAISEKHCKAEYGTDCQYAVKDKIPYTTCPVRPISCLFIT